MTWRSWRAGGGGRPGPAESRFWAPLSPLQWAGVEQESHRLPEPGPHTARPPARPPAHPQAGGRSTGGTGRRDRQELEQGGQEQHALWLRVRGRGMGGGASWRKQLEPTSTEAGPVPALGWDAGLGPLEPPVSGAQMRECGQQRDTHVSHLGYSAGVGRCGAARQGAGISAERLRAGGE